MRAPRMFSAPAWSFPPCVFALSHPPSLLYSVLLRVTCLAVGSECVATLRWYRKHNRCNLHMVPARLPIIDIVVGACIISRDTQRRLEHLGPEAAEGHRT